jgi:hypothetical protein
MINAPSTITLVSVPLGVGKCDLCGQEVHPRPGTVVVRLHTSAAVEFAACINCVRAFQEVELTSGGLVRFAAGEAPSAPVQTVITQPLAVGEPTGPVAAYRREYPELVQVTDGRRYRVQACGHARTDGTWVGWLEFHPEQAGLLILRTGEETSQPNQEALAYWADGLEPVYFQGAFARAH